MLHECGSIVPVSLALPVFLQTAAKTSAQSAYSWPWDWRCFESADLARSLVEIKILLITGLWVSYSLLYSYLPHKCWLERVGAQAPAIRYVIRASNLSRAKAIMRGLSKTYVEQFC